MYKITFGKYQLIVHSPGLPALYNEYIKHAKFADQIDIDKPEGTSAFLGIGYPNEWPFLAVAFRCIPGEKETFHPGAIIIPETEIVFIGGGERLLAYDLNRPDRLWEDTVDTGFWSWAQHEQYVLMSAELEFAAWDIHANKIWSTFVEPPWSYDVKNDLVLLDVMGKVSEFNISEGPKI